MEWAEVRGDATHPAVHRAATGNFPAPMPVVLRSRTPG